MEKKKRNTKYAQAMNGSRVKPGHEALLFTDAVSRSSWIRYIAVRMPLNGILWKEILRIKEFRIEFPIVLDAMHIPNVHDVFGAFWNALISQLHVFLQQSR